MQTAYSPANSNGSSGSSGSDSNHIINSIRTSKDLVQYLAQTTTINKLGLPEGIYRPDLLPNTDLLYIDVDNGYGVHDNPEIMAAYRTLDYTEGFPALQGVPIWIQLPFEPLEAYLCFEKYLEQGARGARQLYVLPHEASTTPDNADANAKDKNKDKEPTAAELKRNDPIPGLNPAEPGADANDIDLTQVDDKGLDGLNTLSKALTFFDMKLHDLREYFVLYYWGARARAYDMYYAAHKAKEKDRRALEIESRHFSLGEKLISAAEKYLETHGDELIEMLTPSALTDLIKTGAQLQRISTGLPANGVSPNIAQGTSNNANAPLEIVMRQVAEGMSGPTGSDVGETIDHVEKENKMQIAKIMSDPEVLNSVQEIIIKIHSPGTDTPAHAKDGNMEVR